MTILDCRPPYGKGSPPQYVPVFIASSTPCIAPGYEEHRSRLFAGGTFFRSNLLLGSPGTEVLGTICNDISLEITRVFVSGGDYDYTLTVKYQSTIVETYGTYRQDIFNCGGTIDQLRADVNASSEYITMPDRDSDFEDTGGLDADCLSIFGESSMAGGSGGPTDGSTINSIRTGPERTIIVISTTEDANGAPKEPPTARKVQQWDGFDWITYIPNADCI